MCFTIKHFAGDVVYDIEEFTEKNKDDSNSVYFEMLGKSCKKVVRDMFSNKKGKKSKSRGKTKEKKKKTTVCL